MATYHCQVKHGGVGKGLPHADYICREGKYSTGKMKEDLVYKESGNMPEFVKDGGRDYWAAADEYSRINGRTYYEFEVALPQELSNEDNIQMVKDFVAKEIGENKAYTFAIHDKPAANDNEQRQIHAHIMFSAKVQDGIERSREQFFKRYYAKEPERQGARGDDRFSGRNQKGRAAILEVRQEWERRLNRAYEERGIEQSVSCKSLKEQRTEALANGDKEKAFVLDREAQVHLGPKLTYTTRREAAKAVDVEKYFMEQAHPKARHNFVAYQQKLTAIAIVKLKKERILTLQENLENKGIVRSIRDGIADNVLTEPVRENKELAAKEINGDIHKQITLARLELAAAQKELRAFRNEPDNYLLSDKKIMQIANNIYTKGDTKKIRTMSAELKNDIAKYNNLASKYAVAVQNRSLPPNVLNANKKKLDLYKASLDKRNSELAKKVADMKRNLARPSAQSAVAEISKSIRDRIEISKQRIADRKQRIDNLRAQSFVLNETKASLREIKSFSYEKDTLHLHMDRNELEIDKIKLIDNPRERMKAIKTLMGSINAQSKSAAYRNKYLIRRRVNEEFARNAAKSVYTHGEYKKLMQAEKEIKILEKQLAVNPNDPAKRDRLDKLQRDNSTRREKVTAILSTEHARRSIDRMSQSRINKNYVLDSRQAVYKEHIAELNDLKAELANMRQSTVAEIQQERQGHQGNQEMSQGIDAIKNAISSMPEARPNGSLTAKFGSENPYEYKDKNRDTGYSRD